MSRLFRGEALDESEHRHFGSSLAASPISFWLFAGFAALLVAAIGCYMYWGTYSRKRTVPGYILPSKGVITVQSPLAGTVVQRYVGLGDEVHAGQKLYKIVLQHSTLEKANANAALVKKYAAQLASIDAQIKLAKQLEKSRVAQLRRRENDLEAEYARLEAQLQTDQAILGLARKNLARFGKLARGGMVSKMDLQKAKRKVLTRRAAVEQIEKTQAHLQTEIDAIPARISQAQTNAANKLARLKRQAAQIEQQRLRVRVNQEVVVRAPIDGIVSSVITRTGQNVNSRTELLSILPEGSVLEARLLVPARAIGFIHVGEPVRLRYSAFPYQQFGLYRGSVSKVSRSIIVPGELHLPVSLKQPYYLVTASLAEPYVRAYGKELPLTAGMTLSADIVLNHERLYEWILRPIESLRGHL